MVQISQTDYLREFVIYLNHGWMSRAFHDRLGIMAASFFTSSSLPMQNEPRKVREFRRREQEILDTALQLFLDQGEDSVTVEMIADAVGIGKGTIYRSEEHTSELQSLMRISYAVFCLKKKKKTR